MLPSNPFVHKSEFLLRTLKRNYFFIYRKEHDANSANVEMYEKIV